MENDNNVSFRMLSKQETENYLKQDNLISSVCCNELPLYEQQRIKNLFINTFKDDRNEYQKYIMEKKEKETKAIKDIKPIINEYSG